MTIIATNTSTVNKTVEPSHLLCLFLVIILVIIAIVIIIIFFLVLLFILWLLCVVLLFFLGLFNLADCLPFCRETVSFSFVISYYDVVKNCAPFNLPQIKANEAKIIKFVNGIIILIFGVCNLFRFPKTLVPM